MRVLLYNKEEAWVIDGLGDQVGDGTSCEAELERALLWASFWTLRGRSWLVVQSSSPNAESSELSAVCHVFHTVR
jgi:hypothetical protein